MSLKKFKYIFPIQVNYSKIIHLLFFKTQDHTTFVFKLLHPFECPQEDHDTSKHLNIKIYF